MQEPAKKYITPEEYLAMEEKAEYKSEYYKGEIFAFAGGSANHNRVAGNIYAKLNTTLANENCQPYIGDIKVRIEEKDTFTYPDVIVVCGKTEFYPNRDDVIINPLVIIEVLSDSTKNYDRSEKFEIYRSIPSFQEYILVDQYKIHIEHFYQETKGKWIFTEYNQIDDILQFEKIDFEMSLQDIYRRVEFEKEKNSKALRPGA